MRSLIERDLDPDEPTCDSCNVPGPCNPHHIDCTLRQHSRDALYWESVDAAYDSARDRQWDRDGR